MLNRKGMTLATLALVAITVLAFAGEGYTYKCGEKDCGFSPTVIFGGGMMSEQAMGWCSECKAFKSVWWTRKGSPALDPNQPPKAEPKPLAVVWVASLGESRKVYKCPTCKEGSFMEIRKPEELTHCPKCNKPGFKVDPNAPHLAVD